MLDLNSVPPFIYEAPSSSPATVRAHGHAMGAMYACREQIIEALGSVIQDVANLHCGAVHRLGSNPVKAVAEHFSALTEALAAFGDSALELTNADECPGGPYDGRVLEQIGTGIWAAAKEAVSPTDEGDYTESNRLGASDVVNLRRAG